ncbi:hypothetical protein [Erwinia oleae]|uniref:hypothetical protein n=1 Tax=Erwinia oleae TaxID=796334 RepID=UPI00054FEB13|nr:hypothetical protein [Erwinia oleae]
MSLYEMVSTENDDVKLHYFPRVRSACGRHLTLVDGDKNLNFSSCDYLDMADNKLMKDAAIKAIQKYGTNISGPMIFCGYTEYHEELENRYSEMYRVKVSEETVVSYQQVWLGFQQRETQHG